MICCLGCALTLRCGALALHYTEEKPQTAVLENSIFPHTFYLVGKAHSLFCLVLINVFDFKNAVCAKRPESNCDHMRSYICNDLYYEMRSY